MKKRIRFILIILVLAAGAYGVYYLYNDTDFFRISSIEYNEHESLDLYDVQRYSGIPLGTVFFSVNTRIASINLETHPYVKNATVSKHFPGKLKIEIVYREHAFNIIYSDIILSLDDQLHVLEVLDHPKEGVLVEGFAFDSFSTGELIQVSKRYLLENIVLLIQLFEKSDIEVLPSIYYEKDGISVQLNEMKAKFGDGENIEHKFNNFIAIYENLIGKEISTGVIDVSSDGLPVYKPFGE